MSDPWSLLAAAVVGVIATARATRLITSDAYPPMMWVRNAWDNWSGRTEARAEWTPLLSCPFCAAPYVVAVDLAWFLLAAYDGDADLAVWSAAWWIVNGWAAIAYLAAMLVVRDEPPEDD